VATRAAIGSRVVVWLAALSALALFGRGAGALVAFDPHRLTEPFHSGLLNAVFAPAARWDSAWYLGIVQHGYSSRASSAFFPLYPLLVRAFTPVCGSAVAAGTVISLGALAGALSLLGRLARLDLGERAADTTVLLLALFPTAFFLSAVYSESLYLLLSFGAILAARQARWDVAGALGCAAALSRPNGVLVAVPIALIYLSTYRRIDRSALWLALIPLGLIAYLGYAAVLWHNPLEPFVAQAFYGRAFGGLFGGVFHALAMLPGDVLHLASGDTTPAGAWDPVTMELHRLVDLAFLAFAVAGVVLSRRRLPFAYQAYSVLMLLSSTSYPNPGKPLEALPRYVIVIFPLFMAWAAWLTERGRERAAIAGSTVILVVFSGLWGIWSWVA
jgi:mannosyltransferase PIG-V